MSEQNWYSRQYLGKHFDRFLKSEMKLRDFMLLQEVLQEVLVQLRLSNNFIKNGYQSKTGKIRIRQNEQKEMFL